jgi:hypothetical protein
VSRPTILVLAAVGFLAAAPAQAVILTPPPLTPIHRVHALEGSPARVIVALPYRARHQVTVRFATRSGSARAGRDFRAVRGTLRIAKGRRHGVVVIPTLRDHADELTETFTVRFSRPTGAPLSRRSTVVHIIDENAEVVSVAPRTIHEPARSTASVPIGAVVTLHGAPLSHAVTIGYEVVSEELTTDKNDADIASGHLRFAPGERRKVIPGVIRGDTLDEDDEHLLVVLTGDRGIYARPGAVITIVDDPGDMPPSVSIADLTAPEDESGAAQVPLTLSAPSERPVSVSFTTAPGTATTHDYVTTTGTVTFPPDQTTAYAYVALDYDLTDEPDQTFTVTISSPVDATLGAKTTATVTIVDDDGPPTISIGDNTVTEPATSTSMTISLNRASEKTVTVTPSITGGTAQVGSDCSTPSADPIDILALPAGVTVTLAPGATQAMLNLVACDDAVAESAATVLFGLSDPVNAVLGDAAGTLNVLDND